MSWGGGKSKRRFRARPKWGSKPGNLLAPRNKREERKHNIPLPIPRSRGRNSLGRKAGWVRPKAEEPPPPIRLGSQRSMNLGMTQERQEQQQRQWQRLPGEQIVRRLNRKFGPRPYRPPPIPRGQYRVEIIGQEESPA